MHPLKRLGCIRAGLEGRVHAHRHNKSTVSRDHVGALIRKVPLQPEVAFMPRRRVRGNDGHEKRAVVNLTPDLLIPGVPAPKFTLVEPDFNTGAAECLENPLGRLRILRGVAQKYRMRGLNHWRDYP